MRMCSKFHSEGHSQGKFGICESSIKLVYFNVIKLHAHLPISFDQDLEIVEINILTILFQNQFSILSTIDKAKFLIHKMIKVQ